MEINNALRYNSFDILVKKYFVQNVLYHSFHVKSVYGCLCVDDEFRVRKIKHLIYIYTHTVVSNTAR